jgi:hypothetical protein
MKQFSFLFNVVILGMVIISPFASASMISPGGRTIASLGSAPWIFLAEVQSIEIVTDAMTPASTFPKWQALYTRFRVIRGIKGPFHEGYEVELKECAYNASGHPFCGSIYRIPLDVKIGDLFVVVTGPGHPNAYGYQSSVRGSLGSRGS